MRKILCSAVALAVLTSVPAHAQSTFDELIRSCALLYTIKNDFYNRKGLCFTRPGAIKLYPDNPRTCVYRSSADLPMSANETGRMKLLRSKELELGCNYVRP